MTLLVVDRAVENFEIIRYHSFLVPFNFLRFGWDWVHLVPRLLNDVSTPDDKWVWSSRWSKNWQGKPEYLGETCPSATLSTKYLTWTDLRSNPVHSSRKRALTAWAMARPLGVITKQSVLSTRNYPVIVTGSILYGTKWLFLRPHVQNPTLRLKRRFAEGTIKRGSTTDHCRSQCKGQEGPPLIHSFIS
jgi:hypothetical protein